MVDTSGNPNAFIVASVIADVTGDGVPDKVFLMGQRDEISSIFIKDVSLVIEDGSTKQIGFTTFRNNAGYNPRLFIGDFTGNTTPQILISIDSGGSGGFGFYYIYSYKNMVFRRLFDVEEFNRTYKYNVIFREGCRVAVYSEYFEETYLLDVGSRVGFYHEQGVYSRNCELLKPTSGFVPGLNNLYPLASDTRNRHNLLVLQRIIGLFGADTLGYLETTLKWNDTGFRGIAEAVRQE